MLNMFNLNTIILVTVLITKLMKFTIDPTYYLIISLYYCVFAINKFIKRRVLCLHEWMDINQSLSVKLPNNNGLHESNIVM